MPPLQAEEAVKEAVIRLCFMPKAFQGRCADEGPMARVVGLHGNRTFELYYRPAPYIESLNVALFAVPSLYDYQLRKRLAKD